MLKKIQEKILSIGELLIVYSCENSWCHLVAKNKIVKEESLWRQFGKKCNFFIFESERVYKIRNEPQTWIIF